MIKSHFSLYILLKIGININYYITLYKKTLLRQSDTMSPPEFSRNEINFIHHFNTKKLSQKLQRFDINLTLCVKNTPTQWL